MWRNEKVTIQELRAGLEKVGINLAPATCHELFTLFDRDHDGKIVFKELQEMLKLDKSKMHHFEERPSAQHVNRAAARARASEAPKSERPLIEPCKAVSGQEALKLLRAELHHRRIVDWDFMRYADEDRWVYI